MTFLPGRLVAHRVRHRRPEASRQGSVSKFSQLQTRRNVNSVTIGGYPPPHGLQV
jgi:hypothetical protein